MVIGFTGSRGFIGAYLLRYVVCRQLGHVRILVRNEKIDERETGIEIMGHDLLSLQDCERFVDGLDLIFYLAHSHTPVNSDLDQPNDALLNMVPLLNLLHAIQMSKSRPHIVYFSSGGATYGRRSERVPLRETDPCEPSSSYGIQKLAAEHYLRLAAERGHLTCAVLRVSNAYGTLLPRHRMQGLVGVALNSVLHNVPVRVFGSLDNVRDYVHLQDICAIAEKVAQPREPFTILNVGSGEGHSVTDVLNIIQDCVKRPFQIERVGDPQCAQWLTSWVVLDIGKANAELQWAPGVALRTGIGAMVAEWHAGNCVQFPADRYATNS